LVHNHLDGLIQSGVDIVRGDITDKDSLLPLLKDVDIVFHLAARISISGDPDGLVYKINAEGTRNLLEVARIFKPQRIIHFSSIHAFSQHPIHEPLDEFRPLVGNAGFAYDRSKAEGERLVQQYIRDGNDAVILSPTAIIGPVDFEPSLVGQALIDIYHHRIPSLVPGGYNWVDVRDVVDAAIAAIEKGRSGEKYLLSGTWHSLEEFSALIGQITGRKTVKMVLPMWAAWVGLPFIALQSRISGKKPLYTSESLVILKEGNRKINNHKARVELGFQPRTLHDTIRDTLSWMYKNNMIKK
jgi:dihydroflavonol-4-reductase